MARRSKRSRSYYYRRLRRYYRKNYWRSLGNRTLQASANLNTLTQRITIDGQLKPINGENYFGSYQWLMDGFAENSNNLNFNKQLRLYSKYRQFADLFAEVKLLGCAVTASIFSSYANTIELNLTSLSFGDNVQNSIESQNKLILPYEKGRVVNKYFKNYNSQYYPSQASAGQTGSGIYDIGALTVYNVNMPTWRNSTPADLLPGWNIRVILYFRFRRNLKN